MIIEHLSKSREETITLGQHLAGHLKRGDIVCLFGELGSGKTTLTKGIAKGLRIEPDTVSSPSFVLLNIYEGKLPLYHFDLYRAENYKQVLSVGSEEYLYGEGVSVVEWAQRMGTLLPDDHLAVHFFHRKDDQRLIRISASGKRSRLLMEHLKL
ncbi:MAG TPA: tRNA (adenosine(37)-N6)-threonylcarbamoyltransferase complex ATPase subunit type 1 TsaE [Candidatus Omnitrophota bacterium]|nr:tRNA (adenosine(37)-N6)-threonylcarbamoyltransferase complex ATPase subunit type 1 TsaE [Candidatus Omnitrophota bacterium]HPD84798.1 tRNA (adenosine(37)-N6)-threonylcarbamoyltransferase complex ATPase subunit type 1 TsaE [Candidatus Omnitrophota bacterium]HRZ03656.1 tRNA (adenosine(37)-N6)-threonylcarbamoyltransferase complex ATPase subunit type 1 TsaE [Candidatus Omnitrophota bacterium]